MNILELDSYNLADAVKFNNQLNPRIWDGEKMRPEVRKKLLEIAADFKESLGLSDLDIEDITVSGSNAGFTYTPHSDIDLHLVVRMPEQCDEVYQELFNAKKYQYNDEHDIKIGGYDVELYVQPADQKHVSAGVYSVKNDDWIHIPRKVAATANDAVVKDKYELVKSAIDSALKSHDDAKMRRVWDKVKEMRKAGLAKNGELGPENLAFKMLRTQGDLGKLKDSIRRARDAELSLAEQNKVKKPFVYGYKSVAEDATATPDGVNPTTQMFLNEKEVPPQEEIIRDFLNFVVEKLNIDQVPKLRLKKDPQWSIRNHSFGRYDNATGELIVALGNRHIMDILRTLAHELTHRKQDEREPMPQDAGETGSSYENEANAQAGVLMREYAGMHPEYFDDVPVSESILFGNKIKEAEKFNWADWASIDPITGQCLSMESVMEICETYLLKTGNLLESNTTESVSYFKDLFNLGVEPAPGSKYLMTMLMLVNDKILVSHGIEIVKVIKEISPGEYIVELSNGRTAKFPQNAVMSNTMHHSFFFTNKSQYEKLKTAIKLKFDTDLTESASGYIPTKAQAKDPRYAMALTVDIKPGQVGQEANKMALKTNKQGKPGLLIKSANLLKEYEEFKAGIVNEDEDLFEIKMTSKNLSKLAKEISDVKVGLEFEMIVPNVSSDDSGDQEPDYDQDERVRDIDDAINFFDDGDYNYGSVLRRVREEMESNFFDWQMEKIDEAWDEQGFEFFKEYLDREDPFLPEDFEDRAEDEVKADYPDLDPTSDEFEELKSQKLREIEDNYYTETWEAQGRSYDYAREEFEDEQRDNFSEQDWLESEGIRYASDIQNAYTDLTWPYWRSSNEGETDTKEVALNFMNAMGYDTVAVGDYHGYGGGYEKWNGSEWRKIGSNKPDDCFTIEPDGSLQTDDADDSGLEFVSPPIPLANIGDTMKRVQQWAAANGVYTGKSNATSMHTNISIPGYDLDNLDYLKAAILLGDEHVLREFDRIGNTYAKPAIEKVRQLVKSKPEKAQELLDKMKSHLNAEASKLIHSGQTDKYTSINTKDNRIEFRSPGGDYLSDIADNPQKMIDTINRMVVTLDAAMDPDKYKQEYQKKLYKVLTGQGGGREAATGKKQEMKASDKDLLNIFSRYAAGELPKAALKSFVRQAQLQRNVAKGKEKGRMWWNVKYNGQRIEVVADSEMQAKQVAAKEWGLTGVINSAEMTAEPLRPYEEKPEALQPAQQGGGIYKIFDTNGRLIAGDEYGSDRAALARAGVWAMQRGVDVVVKNAQGEEIGRVSAAGEITPTAQQSAQSNTDAIRQAVGRNIAAQSAQTNQGNWGIWIINADRFANQPGEYSRGATVPLYRFPNREAAEQWIEQQRAERPNMRTDIEVREIEPATPIPGSTLDLQRQRAAQQGADTRVDYELYNRTTGEVIDTYQFSNDEMAMNALDGYREGPGSSNPESFGIRRGPGVTNANNLRPRGPGPWEVANSENNQVYFNPTSSNRSEAEAQARTWLSQNGHNPDEFEIRTREGANSDAAQGGIVDVATDRVAPRTLTTPGQPQQQFTGEWKIVDPDGNEIYRFGGVGNAQADANRVAMAWLQRNPRQMIAGVEVLPVMG